MSLIRYYVGISENELEEISKDYDDYEEAVDDVCNERSDDVYKLGEEFLLIEFLLGQYAEEFDNTLSISFKDVISRIDFDERQEFYLDVNSVSFIADKFNKFSDDEFRLRFNSTEFKAELEQNKFMRDIFSHLNFGNESYFQGLLHSFRKLSEFLINMEKKKYVIIFFDV